jgi:lipopolysaccharide export LptBFGC system permease protein LptF
MRRRLIDPAVADLQAEVSAARRTGSAWRLARALGAGYLSLAKVAVLAVCGDLRAGVTTWEHDEADRAGRGVLIAIAIIAVATALLERPFFDTISHEIGAAERARLAAYLAPMALPLSVPLGLAVATAWILHGPARTRKVAAVALLTGLLASAAMFVNIGWVTPDANQAFRQAAFSQPGMPAPVRGDNELRFGDLRAELDRARDAGRVDDVRHLESLYYRKWSVSVAPFAIVSLMIAAGFRRVWTRAGLIAVACAAFAAFYALVAYSAPLAERGLAQPVVLEWAFNALCAAAIIAILGWRRSGRPAAS